MNPKLALLQPYPFEKLNALKAAVTPPATLSAISLSIGEPKHPAPQFVCEELLANINTLANYPLTKGSDALRNAIARWLTQRFSLPHDALDPNSHILPVNGTREALFAFAQCVIDPSKQPSVLMPNPFYQIYEGAAYLAGAEPIFLNTTQDNGFIPDFSQVSADTWQRCQLLYICSPGNPTGAALKRPVFEQLIRLAKQHDFIIASDECYSEIYPDESSPPQGLLGTAAAMGHTNFEHCIVFHSLSKRSNLPGLRSGFVAGDAQIIKKFLLYRTYHGCAMPLANQAASEKAWSDENHVIENRQRYREKFDAVIKILSAVTEVTAPDASFYLWLKTLENDEIFAQKLFCQKHVTLLPGSYLSRSVNGINPGEGYVRLALVAQLDECIEAAQRIKEFIQENYQTN